MQTFLPYPDFTASALVLDPRRLGKQRVETLYCPRGLVVPGYGWRHFYGPLFPGADPDEPYIWPDALG
jgi:hypothetical protein